jgi:hypothetical protein
LQVTQIARKDQKKSISRHTPAAIPRSVTSWQTGACA